METGPAFARRLHAVAHERMGCARAEGWRRDGEKEVGNSGKRNHRGRGEGDMVV